MTAQALASKLHENGRLDNDEWIRLLSVTEKNDIEDIRIAADRVRREKYGTSVYLRALIEISSYCKNDCYYCGIRCGNKNASRFRLSREEILSSCKNAYELGFRTFVLQGGEDMYFSDDVFCTIISDIKNSFPDCALTLSVGEKSRLTYKRYYDAGADRYLLRHETANNEHYRKLHPQKQKLSERIQCLYYLKDIGFQVGSGFMVGSPYQTVETLAEDMSFLSELRPQMVGIGPFLPHKDTEFAHFPSGSASYTCYLLSLIRLMLPDSLIPATTALGTVEKGGREKGLRSGANVIMPNLSPNEVRSKYSLYDNKLSTGAETREKLTQLALDVSAAGYETDMGRGDFKPSN